MCRYNYCPIKQHVPVPLPCYDLNDLTTSNRPDRPDNTYKSFLYDTQAHKCELSRSCRL
jgi:hypothetical protein